MIIEIKYFWTYKMLRWKAEVMPTKEILLLSSHALPRWLCGKNLASYSRKQLKAVTQTLHVRFRPREEHWNKFQTIFIWSSPLFLSPSHLIFCDSFSSHALLLLIAVPCGGSPRSAGPSCSLHERVFFLRALGPLRAGEEEEDDGERVSIFRPPPSPLAEMGGHYPELPPS